MKFQTKAVYDALMKIAESSKADDDTRNETKFLTNQLLDFKVIVSLNVWYDLLYQVNIVSKCIQGFTIDIKMAITLINNCVKYINEYRETGYENAKISSKEQNL